MSISKFYHLIALLWLPLLAGSFTVDSGTDRSETLRRIAHSLEYLAYHDGVAEVATRIAQPDFDPQKLTDAVKDIPEFYACGSFPSDRRATHPVIEYLDLSCRNAHLLDAVRNRFDEFGQLEESDIYTVILLARAYRQKEAGTPTAELNTDFEQNLIGCEGMMFCESLAVKLFTLRAGR